MLLDVLSGFDELKICSSYRMPDGSVTERFIPDARGLLDAQPIWETLPGWQGEIDDTQDRADLPPEALGYLARIEEILGLPIHLVSVGPERTQTLEGTRC